MEELQRQRSLEREAHLAQVSLGRPLQNLRTSRVSGQWQVYGRVIELVPQHECGFYHALKLIIYAEDSILLAQVKRLESQIVQAEAQARAAEEACAALQQELQQQAQTLEETRASSDLHVQVCSSLPQ